MCVFFLLTLKNLTWVVDNCDPGKKKKKRERKFLLDLKLRKILFQNYFIWTKSRKKIMSTRTSTNYMVQWKWSHHMTGGFYITKKSPLLYPLRMAWYSGYFIGKGSNVGGNGKKTVWNDIHKKSEKKDSRAVDWGGEKKPFSQTSARLASIAVFSGSFSPTAELGPRLECLDETPKNVIYI